MCEFCLPFISVRWQGRQRDWTKPKERWHRITFLFQDFFHLELFPQRDWLKRGLMQKCWRREDATHNCFLKGTSATKTNGKMWEFFPSRGPPLPVWEPHVCEKKNMVYFAFQDLRNIFGFQKNVHFWVVLWFVEVGTGDPTPPRKRKIPTLSRFVIFFLQNEHSGTQNKINLKWSNWSDNTSPLL